MTGIIAAFGIVSALMQTTWQLPVTIRAKRDVPVENSRPLGHQEIGRLYVSPRHEPFVIRKGDTFQMIAIGQESRCRISR